MATATVPQIADAKRQTTVDHILVAALALLFADGLNVTMDEIADAAGVARRTVFRHFPTRERLVAEALEAGMRRYGEHLPAYSGDWHGWLTALCAAAHQMHAGYGPGYWELTSRTDLPAEVAAVERRRRLRRRRVMTRIADKLWQEAGGSGGTPPIVATAVGAYLSPRFTAAVTGDVGAHWTVAADLASSAIANLVEATV